MKSEEKRKAAIALLMNRPAAFARLVGFDKINDELHNDWIRDMVIGVGDRTLQAHRGSYKTTCVVVGLGDISILFPRIRMAFMRKTDTDVKEVIAQVKKILENENTKYLSKIIWGREIKLIKSTATEISTDLIINDPRGSAQITGLGTGGSLTGKHFDLIFTDDIVNVQDRVSRAERERIKIVYQELQNIRNRGGRIFNTGTPWHEDDAFSIMPTPERFDCYTTGLISSDELSEIRASMVPSLFAANYELKHIPSEKILFVLSDGQTGANPAKVENAPMCHIDAAYGGEDYTAFTIARKSDGKIYVFGKLWHDHVGKHMDEIINLRKRFMAGPIWSETNADKGYLSKELGRQGERTVNYTESMNKHLKIVTYLYAEWRNIVFVTGTDPAYIKQITEYNDEAEHDDAPDSLASCIVKQWYRQDEGKKIPSLYGGVFGA